MFIGYALLTVSMLLYFVTVGLALPSLLLRPKYTSISLDARGRRRCLVNGKRCVVYERCLNQRRYINRYLLCQGEGCKLLKCQVSPSVRYMEYEVVLFDRYDRIFDVIHVKEEFSSRYGKLLFLPDETSYVSLRLQRVNKTSLAAKPMTRIVHKNVLWFALCALLLSVLEGVVVMVGCAYAFGGVFREDFARSTENILLSAVVAAVAICVGMVFVIIAARRQMKT